MDNHCKKLIKEVAQTIDEFQNENLDPFILNTYLLINETNGHSPQIWFDEHDFILDENKNSTSLMKKIWLENPSLGASILEKTNTIFDSKSNKDIEKNNVLISKRVCVFFQKITGHEKINKDQTIFECIFEQLQFESKNWSEVSIQAYFAKLYQQNSLNEKQKSHSLNNSAQNYLNEIEQHVEKLTSVNVKNQIKTTYQELSQKHEKNKLKEILFNYINTVNFSPTTYSEEIAYFAPVLLSIKSIMQNDIKEVQDIEYKKNLLSELTQECETLSNYAHRGTIIDFLLQYEAKSNTINIYRTSQSGDIIVSLNKLIAINNFKNYFSENVALNEKNKIEILLPESKPKTNQNKVKI